MSARAQCVCACTTAIQRSNGEKKMWVCTVSTFAVWLHCLTAPRALAHRVNKSEWRQKKGKYKISINNFCLVNALLFVCVYLCVECFIVEVKTKTNFYPFCQRHEKKWRRKKRKTDTHRKWLKIEMKMRSELSEMLDDNKLNSDDENKT